MIMLVTLTSKVNRSRHQSRNPRPLRNRLLKRNPLPKSPRPKV